MTFLPVVERELRVASRRRGTYWNRFLAALVGLLVFGFVFLNQAHSPPREVGLRLFYVLSGVFLAVALLSGVRYTADCLSEEKREGTLGLLFLTDLKGYDVVLGKLVATSINACYGLVAIVPVLAIPLLLGGVSFAEFGRMVVVLVDGLVFSLAAGLFVSALTRHARPAMAATLLLILAVQAGLPAVGAWLAFRYQPMGTAGVDPAFLTPSAGYAYARAMDNGFRAGPFLRSVGLIHGLSWALLILASLIAPYSWQDKGTAAVRTGWRGRWRRLWEGSEETARALRRRLLDINPGLWLGGRHRWKPALVWGFVIAAGVGWLIGFIQLQDDWLNEAVCITIAFAVHLVLKLWVASEACLRFGPDRRSGALELVLSTPLTVKELLHGQMLALRRQFLGPVCVVLVVDVLFLISILRSEANPGWFIGLAVVGITTFLVDLYALAWTGMWVGLITRHPNRAAGATATRILVFFWLAYAGILFFIDSLDLHGQFLGGEGAYLVLYFALGVGLDAGFLAWSRFRLSRDLRAVVTQRFEPSRPLWTRPPTAKGKLAAGPTPLAPAAP